MWKPEKRTDLPSASSERVPNPKAHPRYPSIQGVESTSTTTATALCSHGILHLQGGFHHNRLWVPRLLGRLCRATAADHGGILWHVWLTARRSWEEVPFSRRARLVGKNWVFPSEGAYSQTSEFYFNRGATRTCIGLTSNSPISVGG